MPINPEQARLGGTDSPFIRQFADAYLSLHKTALDHPGRAALTPEPDGENLVARFTGEQYEVSFLVPSANIVAANGVRGWLQRRRMQRLPPQVHVDVMRPDEDYPVNVYLNCRPSGKYMLSPSMSAYRHPATPRPRAGDDMRGRLADITARMYDLGEPITSRDELTGRAQAVIDIAARKDTALLTFEQPGQRLPDHIFWGEEKTALTAALRPLVEAFPPPASSHHDIMKGRMFPETVARNELALTDTMHIEVRVSGYELRLHMRPREGQTGPLPPLNLVGPIPNTPEKWGNPLLHIEDADGNLFNLSRSDRQILLALLSERLNPADFTSFVQTPDLLRPDDEILNACARLAPGGEGQDFQHIFSDPTTGTEYAINILSGGSESYTIAIRQDGDFLMILTLDRTGYTVHMGRYNENILLGIYGLIKKAGAPPETE